jgi:two-component system LytT family response regulator
MLKAIIIDDVKEFRDAIARHIAQYNSDITVVSEADGVVIGENRIREFQPDIVFLDVEMPDGTGFDLLNRFDIIDFKVIFVTAYMEFSIKAFKFSAIDYILKPIDPKELQIAIRRAKEIIDKESLTLKFASLLSNINKREENFQKLILKTAEYIFSVEISDIVRCEADKSYTTFFLTDGRKIIVSKTLKEYDDLLVQHNFFRVHHSHLINMKYLDHLVKSEGVSVIMKDKSKVPVSFRKKDDLIKRIEGS